MAESPRSVAFKVLLRAEQQSNTTIDNILAESLRKSTLSDKEKRWVTELVYGVTRWKLQLDWRIEQLFKGKYHKAQHGLKVILRSGLYQIDFMQTETYAAINESVNLAIKEVGSGASGLVNAILRNLQRTAFQEELKKIGNSLTRLSIETSHPEWLLERWLNLHEEEAVRKLCAFNNHPPEFWIRRNNLIIDQTQFEQYLIEHDIPFRQSELLSGYYEIDKPADLLKDKIFSAGWFSVQDIAAGLIPQILDPKPGEIVLDPCASPGGKTAALSELSGGGAKIYAYDSKIARMAQLEDTVHRLRLNNVSIKVADARSASYPAADKILLDVPCSGTGVLHRRADARWRRKEEDIEKLVQIQKQIIRNTWQALKPGGLMVYATCTLEPEENWDVIDAMLPELIGSQIEIIENEAWNPYVDKRGALAILPWKHDMDGMFAVKIRKR